MLWQTLDPPKADVHRQQSAVDNRGSESISINLPAFFDGIQCYLKTYSNLLHEEETKGRRKIFSC